MEPTPQQNATRAYVLKRQRAKERGEAAMALAKAYARLQDAGLDLASFGRFLGQMGRGLAQDVERTEGLLREYMEAQVAHRDARHAYLRLCDPHIARLASNESPRTVDDGPPPGFEGETRL